jgi:hypothetical protein
MLRLSASLAAAYRPATDREVRHRSFGIVKAPRDAGAATWQARRGTLDDQAIFGPVRDFHCVCGKYQWERYRGMVCDRCFVKVTTRESRRQRFGHMELPVAVLHPLGELGERLSAIPVLPAAFWQAPAGSQLAQGYDELARAVASGVRKPLASGCSGLPDGVAEPLEQVLAAALDWLFAMMLPVAEFAHQWDLAEAQALAHGLALERRDDR